MCLLLVIVSMVIGFCALYIYIKDDEIQRAERSRNRIIKLQSDAYDDILKNESKKH
jgi:hypothetical protein